MTRQEFYRTKEWKSLRDQVRLRDRLKCNRCKKIVPTTWKTSKNGIPYSVHGIVHHKIHLTDENYLDASISLNPDNCELLCISCHNIVHYANSNKYLDEDGNFDFDKRDDEDFKITIDWDD